ncbi:MAG TPA: type II toxin-antitoxin system RelE/ParE family toxin [Thermoanaerobaculia bacterium]|jgi:mRNA-degrading endonuclease RelE of RelBE toxin-antitoxin system|nr:type II toxin-antitoxin system RelE/ParE family toxin [Thermoanaerobaculia bacterium]
MSYEIEFAESVKRQLRALTAHQRAEIFDGIEEQLTYEPFMETRNRKLLRPNPFAPWELRVGDLRIFYEPAPDGAPIVRVLAVGVKKGSILRIGGQEVKL